MRDCLITVISLLCAFVLSLLFQYSFGVREHISTVFVFAVFLVSLLTEGYIYGVAAAFIGTVAVNYAFTFPYFTLNFTIQVNLISGIIMKKFRKNQRLMKRKSKTAARLLLICCLHMNCTDRLLLTVWE